VTSLTEDLNKARDKIANLLSTIDELQTADSAAQLATKRAERDLRESQERALRLEREIEGWKGLRFDRTPTVRSTGLRVPSYGSSVRGRRMVSGGSQAAAGPGAATREATAGARDGTPSREISRRDGTPLVESPAETMLSRKVSNTKGFL
jgi:myosin protein heavy chain